MRSSHLLLTPLVMTSNAVPSHRLALAAALASTPFLLSFGCQKGNSTVEASTETTFPASAFALESVTNGFGQLLPHRAHALDVSGVPTAQLVDLRSVDDVLKIVGPNNPVLPAPMWPTSATLPTGAPGNHFVAATLTADLDIAAALADGLEVVGTDALTGLGVPVQGRAFVDGWTSTASGLAQWVTLDGAGQLATAPQGLGFPGSESALDGGAAKLVNARTIVFVADSDGDLATHETFPAGMQIGVRLGQGALGAAGEALSHGALASATVGVDTVAPEWQLDANGLPVVSPAPGAIGVDVSTTLQLGFTEPIQPFMLGQLGTVPGLSPAVSVRFGSQSAQVEMLFAVRPLSAFDLSRYELVPSFAFPGTHAASALGQVRIQVQAQAFADLGGTLNQGAPSSFFVTGAGPGMSNAPVAPDAIYVARAGGLSVIDLNGFGQGTGNPTFDPVNPITKGNSNFPNNPNVWIQGALLIPPLAPGLTTVDGGSEGVFTLTKDSNLSDLLVTSPIMESVGDMMLGQPLDSSFNNGPPPFGCQSGGGNLCASTGLKLVTPVLSGNSLVPAQPGQFTTSHVGVGNLISWAPHPNPPPLTFPPLCVSPAIGGQEPTTMTATTGLINLLVPGANSLGDPGSSSPPTNLLSPVQNAFFQGPGSPQTQIGLCPTYQIRQQVGHFLYVADAVRREVVVLNSNRMTVIDRISVDDPRSFAMSPDLTYLAVSNTRRGRVEFIDIDPSSATFHQIVQSTVVGKGPLGVAWQPNNEDILVCNERDGTVSILSALTLQVRKVVTKGLDAPFEVAVSQRQDGFGFGRQTYFAYILDRNGKVALFESGPDGINGWGSDDVIGVSRFTFENPKAMQADPFAQSSGVWIAHERALDASGQQVGAPGTGAMTNLQLSTMTLGQLPTSVGGPTLAGRDLQFKIGATVGASELTGIPVDLAFDNLRNLGGLPDPANPFGAGTPAVVNGKAQVKKLSFGAFASNQPTYMFVTVPNSSEGPGVIDAIELATMQRIDTDPFLSGIQSIPAKGALGVMDYFRQ